MVDPYPAPLTSPNGPAPVRGGLRPGPPGAIEGAKSVLREAADELRTHAAGSPNAEELKRLAADIEEDLPFLDEGVFDASSSKQLHYKQMTSSYRRLQLRNEALERRKEQP